jgi:hypothetical protein
MNSAYISALAAFSGSSIGVFVTFAQSYQNRVKSDMNERARQTLATEFPMNRNREFSWSLQGNAWGRKAK